MRLLKAMLEAFIALVGLFIGSLGVVLAVSLVYTGVFALTESVAATWAVVVLLCVWGAMTWVLYDDGGYL